MNEFLNETMTATASEIYADDAEKICWKLFEAISIIGKYRRAKKLIRNRFVVFLLNWACRIITKGY